MMLQDVSGNPIPKIPKKVGTIFLINGRPFRRGVGILYSAHRGGMDPTLRRAFWKRYQKRTGMKRR